MKSKSIIVCVDGTAKAEHALEYVIGNVLRGGDHIQLLHVQGPKEHPDAIHEAGVLDPIYSVDTVQVGCPCSCV